MAQRIHFVLALLHRLVQAITAAFTNSVRIGLLAATPVFIASTKAAPSKIVVVVQVVGKSARPEHLKQAGSHLNNG